MVAANGWEVSCEVPRVHLRKHVGGHAAPVAHSIFQMRVEGRGHILWAILRCVLSPSVSAECALVQGLRPFIASYLFDMADGVVF